MNEFKVVPTPPDDVEALDADVWNEAGRELLNKGLLTNSALSQLEDLCFWERQKRQVMKRLDTASSGPEIMSGKEKSGSEAADHLSSLRAIQRQIDQTRRELGLPSVEEKELAHTPLIPDVVFGHLPSLLAELAEVHDNHRQRDLFLTACLPVVAAHLCRIETGYADRVVSPDMATCIVDGSGLSGRLTGLALKLGRELNQYLKKDLSGPSWNWMVTDSTPLKRLKERLAALNGRGVIQSNRLTPWMGEPDREEPTLPDGFMASCFSHDPIPWPEGNQAEEHPTHISLLLRTTPGEFRALSRDCWRTHCSYVSFYLFDEKKKWQSARPGREASEQNRNLETASGKLFHLYRILKDRRNPLRVELMDHQWEMIDETFAEKLEILNQLGLSEDLHLSNERMAIQAVRMISAFTALRCYESRPEQLEQAESVQPGHSDMVAALWLADTFIKHAIRLYEQLPEFVNREGGRRGARYRRLLAVLPPQFETSDAVSMAHRLGIPVRTAKRYLRVMLDENLLERVRHGAYRKR